MSDQVLKNTKENNYFKIGSSPFSQDKTIPI